MVPGRRATISRKGRCFATPRAPSRSSISALRARGSWSACSTWTARRLPLPSRSWRWRPRTPAWSTGSRPRPRRPPRRPATRRSACWPTTSGARRRCSSAASAATCRKRVVTNAELVNGFPQTSPDYIFQVTGIRERRWAADDEKPSDMALAASLDAHPQVGRRPQGHRRPDRLPPPLPTWPCPPPPASCRTGSAWIPFRRSI